MNPTAWKVSLHGGHCGQYCAHAHPGTLREVLEAAVAAGYHTFGTTEHAPRVEPRFLYPEELAMSWTVETLAANFEAYARQSRALADEFADRLTVLRGFEIEVVPANGYVALMNGLRERHGFEYIVGSVHYVDEIVIDGPREDYRRAVEKRGSLEALAVGYYEAVAAMVEAMRPEVVGHFDLIRRNAPDEGAVDSPAIRAAAERALEAVEACGGILDVNTAGYRKGLGRPYPAPWVLERARALGIGLCLGDDSHGPADVGAGLAPARRYLLEHGIETMTTLAREGDGLTRRRLPLR